MIRNDFVNFLKLQIRICNIAKCVPFKWNNETNILDVNCSKIHFVFHFLGIFLTALRSISMITSTISLTNENPAYEKALSIVYTTGFSISCTMQIYVYFEGMLLSC